MGTTLHTLKGPRGATRNRKRIGVAVGAGALGARTDLAPTCRAR
jgi:hypothetical protein